MSAHLSRRAFLCDLFEKGIPIAALSGLAGPSLLPRNAEASPQDLVDGRHVFVAKEAMYYKKLDYRKIECVLCPKKCVIDDMERGFCGNRENRGGTYYTLAHSNPCAMHKDPIEKKPLFHFLPTTDAFSISTSGCNFVCKFCQNWQISQFRPEQTENLYLSPERVAREAERRRCTSIAYTYAEPVVFYEYMYDTAVEGKKRGLKSVMISNGYINPEPMRELCKHLDAVKIDFKAYTEKFYRDTCVGTLQPVLDVLELLRDMGIWYEMVYLMVPGLNDSKQELQEMCAWIMEKLGPDVPLHFSRFHPQYMLKNLPPTPVRTIEMARDIGMKAGLNFVYIGNVPGHEGENTYCPNPKCKKLLIGRMGYIVYENHTVGGKCRYCEREIPGVWDKQAWSSP